MYRNFFFHKLVCLLLAFPPFMSFAQSDWINPEHSHYITPYDFYAQGNVDKKGQLEKFIGRGFYNRLSDFYTDVDDVYADFNLDKNLVMSCEDRHQTFYDKGHNSNFKLNAANYFCKDAVELDEIDGIDTCEEYCANEDDTGSCEAFCEVSFDTDSCQADQYKKVYLDYCLDLNDTLDWVAIQSAFLNANGRSVVIPPEKEFYVNQAIVMPDDLKVNWFASEGATTLTPGQSEDGTHYVRPGASFIKYVPQDEPINYDQPRQTGFSVGTMFKVGNVEQGIDCIPDNTPGQRYGFAPYSGISATIREANRVMVAVGVEEATNRKPCDEGIVSNITLRYPHIDVNNVVGENGLSFALGAGGDFDSNGYGPLKVYGGVIKNVKINTYKIPFTDENGNSGKTSKGVVAFAGGKAIQCEAGCRGLDVRGISIIDADIAINSNALAPLKDPENPSEILANYELLNLFGVGLASQVRVLGLRTVNVGSPVNVANTIDNSSTLDSKAAQEVSVNYFAFYNSGSGEWKNEVSNESICLGTLMSASNQTLTTAAVAGAKDGGILTSRNGKNVTIKNGKLINDEAYPGVPALVNVVNTSSTTASPVIAENITYQTKFRE